MENQELVEHETPVQDLEASELRYSPSPPSVPEDVRAGVLQPASGTNVTPDTANNGERNPELEDDYITGYRLAIVIACVALSCFLMLLDTMVISTAIPRITDQFNSLHDVGWYASAYQFGSAAPQPLTGKLYKHFSTKWTFLAFFGVFEVGSVLCGAATSSVMLIIGRAVAGLGAAGIIVGAITIISGCAPLERRPALLGMTMGFNQLGLVAGPLVGGAFTSYSTWRWCFYVNLPVGAIAALGIIVLHVPEQTPKEPALSVLPRLHHHLDLIGCALFIPAVLQLLLALQYGGDQFSWNSSQVIGLFIGCAATFIAWLWWNHRRGDDALLPHSMVTRTAVWTSGIYQAFLMSAVYGATYYLPIYFQAIEKATPILSGVYLLPTILPQLVMAAASGGLIAKIGYVIPLAVFSTIFLTIGSGLYSILRPSSPTGEWIGFQILSGIGSGAGLQVAILAVQAAVTGEELASGMSFVVFTQSLGPSVTLVLCNVIFTANLSSQLAEHAPNVDATSIINAGATAFRGLIQPDDLSGVLVAYANSIDRVFYLVAALAACCGIFLWGMGWHNMKPNKVEENPTSSGTSGKAWGSADKSG